MKNKQIFCFTHAGGNASFFDEIESDISEYTFVKLEYAGHGTRYKEELYKDFDELAEDMYLKLKDTYLGGEYALFGYSMGCISVIEVLKRILMDKDFQNPVQVFLAAHEPYTKAELAYFSNGECDELVKQRTIEFGTVPKVLLNNKTFWRMYIPIYRADYSLIGSYKFENLNLKTTIPATVFYSETDTSSEDMMKWQDIFVGKCDFHTYSGTHFFIHEHHKKMAEVIRKNFNRRIRDDE